jgi:uncharacterized protein
MDSDQVKAKILPHAPELTASGIDHLRVHGSVARGDSTPFSDVDLIADFDGAKKMSLLGRVRLENRLTDILGVKADLADMKMLRSDVLERVERESILVF